ncbi:MAG TPA: S8 family serine peptidase [Bacteroidales bacterium]|nr:S8 family serine peptidase [Bacteroidales bacterium]
MIRKSRRLYKISFIVSVLTTVTITSGAQDKYWVYFTGRKKPNNPAACLDIHAIQRRIALQKDICDSTDWPVDSLFISSVKNLGAQTGYCSRWLNAVAVTSDRKTISKIKNLPCVKEIQPMQYFEAIPASIEREVPLAIDNSLLEAQLKSMQGSEFIKRGIDGKGIRIAVFDGGFPGVDTNPIFAHLRDNHQIIKTYDFVNKKENVYGNMTHGTSVLSCIAGKYEGKNVGLATGAEFLLARTEIKPEVKAEEEYWMAAMEWADKNGADIISSSLGYTDKRYTVKQMNGRSTLVTRAASIAARKGMLVINAMGNDGRENWEVMGAPADADSVLSIGGIDPFTGYHISFSSFGPTSDYRLKPNICAPGAAMVASSSSLKKGYGTSFSTPLISGFAACVWQLNRQKSNMEIFKLMEQSGHLFPYFDYAHGYGIPQASYFFKEDQPKSKAANPVTLKKELTTVDVLVSDLSKSDEKYMNYLYYHIQRPDGVLKYYAVLDVTEEGVVSIPLSKFEAGDVLRVYYKGFISEMNFDNND